MHVVRWLRQSLANLESIHAYYADHGLRDEARRLIARIRSTTMQLESFPLLGRSGRVSGTRELVVTRTSYIVIYRVREDAVEVLRVLHSSQKWPRSDQD